MNVINVTIFETKQNLCVSPRWITYCFLKRVEYLAFIVRLQWSKRTQHNNLGEKTLCVECEWFYGTSNIIKLKRCAKCTTSVYCILWSSYNLTFIYVTEKNRIQDSLWSIISGSAFSAASFNSEFFLIFGAFGFVYKVYRSFRKLIYRIHPHYRR